jgi:hypothetical protein
MCSAYITVLGKRHAYIKLLGMPGVGTKVLGNRGTHVMGLGKRRAIMHVLGSRRPDIKVLGKLGHFASCVQNAGPRAYVKLLRKYIALIENLRKAIADINVS